MTIAAARIIAAIEIRIAFLNLVFAIFIFQNIKGLADKGDAICFEKCYTTLEKSCIIHTFKN